MKCSRSLKKGENCHILALSFSYNSDLTSGLADPCKIMNCISKPRAANMTLCCSKQIIHEHAVHPNDVRGLNNISDMGSCVCQNIIIIWQEGAQLYKKPLWSSHKDSHEPSSFDRFTFW